MYNKLNGNSVRDKKNYVSPLKRWHNDILVSNIKLILKAAKSRFGHRLFIKFPQV